MIHRPDIDIDFGNRDDILALIDHIPASINSTKKHNSGVYVQQIPTDPLNNTASIPYKEADNRGYFKLDFLNVSIYKNIRDQDHYNKLLQDDIPWHKLQDPVFVSELVHISNYFDILQQMKPSSINEMAMFLAAIRPGKKHLLGKEWSEVQKTIWEKPQGSDYYFKKSHSISYAVLVGLHMNILNENH